MELSLITDKAKVQAATTDVVFEYDTEGKPKTGFKIVGPDSIEYLQAQVTQRVTGRKRNIAQQIDFKTDEGQNELERLTQENMNYTANAVVVGWFGFTKDGEPAAFNRETVATILSTKPSWRDKIINALDKESDFLPKADAV